MILVPLHGIAYGRKIIVCCTLAPSEKVYDALGSVKSQHSLFSAPASTLGGVLWVRGGCGLWLLAVG
jgi:hypothetical protein